MSLERFHKAQAGRSSGYAVALAEIRKGRKMGKTKAEFFRDEQAALEPFQPGLFDDIIDG